MIKFSSKDVLTFIWIALKNIPDSIPYLTVFDSFPFLPRLWFCYKAPITRTGGNTPFLNFLLFLKWIQSHFSSKVSTWSKQFHRRWCLWRWDRIRSTDGGYCRLLQPRLPGQAKIPMTSSLTCIYVGNLKGKYRVRSEVSNFLFVDYFWKTFLLFI